MDIAPFLDKPTAIVGTTGAGKTFAAKGAVEQLLELGRRVIIIDPTGAWYGLRAGADGNSTGGFPVLIFGGDHADVPIEPTGEAGKALALALAERHVQAIIDTSEMTGGEKNRFLTPFLENLYARNKAALHLVVDEADEVAAQRLADGEQRLFGAFDKIVRRGRIKGFRPLMISQRPAVIHKNVLSQIGTLIALKLTSPQDRKAIDDWVKGNADADQAKAVMKSLSTLPRGQGWVWSPADDVLKLVKFPAIRTFDSSRTPGNGEAAVAPALTAVDVDVLREAMKVAPVAETSQAPAIGAGKAVIEAAEQRGFQKGDAAGYVRGYELARKDGHANAYRLGFRDAAKKIAAAAELAAKLEPDDIEVPPIAGTPSALAAVHPDATAHIEKSMKAAKVIVVDPLRSIGAGDLPASLQRALDSVAWWHSIGFDEVARNRAAITAGLSPTASTFGVYVGKLVERGLIEASSPGHLRITEAGHHAARRERDLNVLAMAKAQLEPQPARVFDFVVEAYPAAISRGELADKMGLSRTASTLGVYLGKVSRLGFVETQPGSMVRAAEFMFQRRR
ncbi:MAG: DUF87 domain-containing protein [Mesorhizobium sp.]|uniref:helicase HerA domain-containing protein n=1 Tax=Mesorhizobium sp. TaxID=1871066 RepID=UPI00121415E2|nr:DUF87 domain-containing protein [Mesorhizobium sp.]TIN36793.1 MAG: DUF87 domain-containing protein [Mesorhizobium sp.]TJU86638.1 MAG: DUF87 domain-containing protein [Mesorhizobium sp.]